MGDENILDVRPTSCDIRAMEVFMFAVEPVMIDTFRDIASNCASMLCTDPCMVAMFVDMALMSCTMTCCTSVIVWMSAPNRTMVPVIVSIRLAIPHIKYVKTLITTTMPLMPATI